MAQRAAAADHGGFRFDGFAGHYQDFEPSLDHYGFMRTGLNYMLISTVDDAKGSVLLFPAWPSAMWNDRFEMHAPRNTTIGRAAKTASSSTWWSRSPSARPTSSWSFAREANSIVLGHLDVVARRCGTKTS